MAYGNFLSDFYNQLSEIDMNLSHLMSNTGTISQHSYEQLRCIDIQNAIYDIENMTLEDCEELYPYDNPDEKMAEYEYLGRLFTQRLDTCLEIAYKHGEHNIVFSDYYQYKGENAPTFELLNLLPSDFLSECLSPKQMYETAVSSDKKNEKKICLFLSARNGCLPALNLANKLYGWCL